LPDQHLQLQPHCIRRN
jgi:hypothetical protein